MIQEPLIKAAVSFIAIPVVGFVGKIVGQVGDQEAGYLIEKLGVIGAGIIFFTYAVKWFKADQKERLKREEKLEGILENERRAHNEALEKLAAAIRSSCRFDNRDHNK